MPVNPSLRLCSTVCPPLGPLQENMHHLKSEPSAAIEKEINQMPTTKSDTHWSTSVAIPISDVIWVYSKEQTYQKLLHRNSFCATGELRDENKPRYCSQGSPHLGAFPDITLSPFPQQRPLCYLCLSLHLENLAVTPIITLY